MSTVLDASFAVELVLNAEVDAETAGNLDTARSGLVAPVIFWHEIASALRHHVRRGLITPTFRDEGLRRLRALNIELDAPTSLLSPLFAVSDRFQLTIYDAAYLELAIRTGGALATRDQALIAAAPKAGIPLVP